MAKSSENRAKLERAEAKAERRVAALRAKVERKMAKLRQEYEEAVADVRSKLEAKRKKAAKGAAKHGGAPDTGRGGATEPPPSRETKPQAVQPGVARRVAQAALAPGAELPRRSRSADR